MTEEPSTRGPGWWGTPSLRQGTLVMVLVGALIVALVWFFTSRSAGARRAEPGHVETTEAVARDTSLDAEFIVPGARIRLSVTVGSSVSGLTSEAVRAPRGGRLVEVQGNTAPDQRSGSYDVSEVSRARLWLRSGDERILVSDNVSELPEIGSDGPRSVLAFGTAGRDLVAELEYAGRRQSVHLISGRRVAGAFATLYRPAYPGTRQDGGLISAHRGDLEWSSTAAAAWYRTPYVSGLGWAKQGREWLVVRDASLRVTGIRDDVSDEAGTPYTALVEKSRGNVTVPGARTARRPSTTVSQTPGDVEYSPRTAVFDIRANVGTTLRLTVRAPLRPVTDGGSQPPLVVSRSIDVPATPVVGGV